MHVLILQCFVVLIWFCFDILNTGKLNNLTFSVTFQVGLCLVYVCFCMHEVMPFKMSTAVTCEIN